MTGVLERQSDDILPPRKSNVIAVAVTTTAYAYDLTVLSFVGQPYLADQPDDPIFITIEAETADVFVQLAADDTVTLDRTAKITAGQPLVYATTYGARIPANGIAEFRIRRGIDKYLHLQGSTTGICRFWASSAPRYSNGP